MKKEKEIEQDRHLQKNLVVRYRPDEQARLERYAKRHKESKAQVVHAAIDDYLTKHGG